MKLEILHIGFYDPAEGVREKTRHRRQDTQEIREGRLAAVERRNHRLPGARPVAAWETTPPLE